ncbi:ferredoxin III, nif-specific [Vibrio sp. AK197]|uniref:Ferredoxin III, nif-specific n=1 Tax=Vibrio olivae TaxID=1243002 RepID=A0ABV5HL25_9VIBR
MDNVVGYTRGGSEWKPHFIDGLDEECCIGCGRCFKVCSRDVFDLIEADMDDDDEDDVMMVMTIKNGDDCIGCQACASVCSKKCHSFTA